MLQAAIPFNPAVCAKALDESARQQADLSEKFAFAAASYAADDQMQMRIIRELWKKAFSR
ncbi:MAG TPA: hypothetical protein VJ754_06710 [Anaerolineae bacterium]|nr:hypothetical protein [Anaerolineae bacterium]